jgi:ankyrin repeat protein
MFVFFLKQMNIPRDILSDHIRPFIGSDTIFKFICQWEFDPDMVVVLKWFMTHDIMDPFQIFGSNWNLLSWACFHNHQGIIDLLIEKKIAMRRFMAPNIYIHEPKPALDCFMNALDIVSYYNRLDILKKLVAYDPTLIRPTNLFYACEMDHMEMCEFLVGQGVAMDPKCYLSVCQHNNVRLFRLLKENGCPLDYCGMSGRTLLMYACSHECPEIARELCSPTCVNEQDNNGNSALMYASMTCSHNQTKGRKSDEKKKCEIVQMLFDHGADVNLRKKTGSTALFVALQNRFYKIASLLLEKGSDISLQDYNGWNCLMHACYCGDHKATQLILETGVDLNQKNHDGLNALMFACRYKSHVIFDLIMRYGNYDIRLDDQDNSGYTALIYACIYTPDAYIIRKLVRAKADVSLKTIHGATALQMAYEYGADENTLAMLLS